jgi:hypothetical protein
MESTENKTILAINMCSNTIKPRILIKTFICKHRFRFDITTDPDRPAKHEVMIVMKTEAGMYIKAKLRNIK